MLRALILFLLCLNLVSAQDYERIDNRVSNYPEFESIDHLVLRIRNDFDQEEDKCRAIFTWIATNISFDLEASQSGNKAKTFYFKNERDLQDQRRKYKEELAEKVFKKKKAICLGFSVIFDVIAGKLCLETHYIEGITKISPEEIGSSRSIKDHAWNSVKLSGQWYLLDVTWSSTVQNNNGRWIRRFNDFFYLTDPEIFINSHFPGEPYWQLLEEEITLQSFFNQPVLYTPYFSQKVSLLDHVPGIFRPTGKRQKIRILFDDYEFGTDLFYQVGNSGEIRPLYLRKRDESVWVGIINVRTEEDTTLTIYDSKNALIDFKIKI